MKCEKHGSAGRWRAVLASLWVLSGCAAQLSGGPVWSTGTRSLWGTGAVSLRTTPLHGLGPVLGVRGDFSAQPRDGVLVLRSAEGNAGVFLPPQRLGVSPLGLGVDALIGLGWGQPPSGFEPSGQGAYTGLGGSVFLRVLGPSEPRPRLIGGRVVLDLVLGARGGVWVPSEELSTPLVWAGSLELGLRAGLLSDLLSFEPEARQP